MAYDGRRYRPRRLTITVEQNGQHGVAALCLRGPWEGPPEVTRAPGWVDYRLRLVHGSPYLFIDGRIQSPDTRRGTVIQADKPMLARKIDAGWQEVAPVELRFFHHAGRMNPFVVHKRNFLGKEKVFAATIQAVYPDGLISDPSPEIYFKPTQTKAHVLQIPNDFKIKMLWVNVAAWVQRNLL